MSESIEHKTSAGDRWDLLAATYYGDPSLMVHLLRANPELALLPVLPEGLAVRIPILEVDDATESAGDYSPWGAL